MASLSKQDETKRPIALIGFRACGKTLLGRMLSNALGWSFVDMDRELVRGFGCTITAYVASRGWPAFREAESALLRGFARHSATVVATGGGIVLHPCNRIVLRRFFRVVWLRADAQTIVDRIYSDPHTAGQRPPLTKLAPEEEIRATLAERHDHYQRTAHAQLRTDCAHPERLVSQMVRMLGR